MKGKHRKNLFLSIVIPLTTAALTMSIIRADTFWIAISFINLGLLFGISKMEEKRLVKWDIIKLISIPILLGSAGILRIISFGIILPIFSLMVIFNLNRYTGVRVNLLMTLSLIILFSIAVGAIIGLGRFVIDLIFDTTLLRHNDDFMGYLFVIALFAFTGSYIAKKYLENKDYDLPDHFRSRFKTDSVDLRKEFIETLNDGFSGKIGGKRRLISQFLQVGLGIVLFYGFYTSDLYIFVLALFAFILSIFPYIYTVDTERNIPSIFHFWMLLILFLYVIGEVAGRCTLFGIPYFWWNKITHFMSGTLIAIFTYIILIYLNRISEMINIPLWLIPILVVTLMVSISAIWEIFEFLFDKIFTATLQDNLLDTITDIAFDMVGTFLGLSIANIFYSKNSDSSFYSKDDDD